MTSNNENGKYNGDGIHSNDKQTNNANGNLANPAITAIQNLEHCSSYVSDIQPKQPSTAPRYVPQFDQSVILQQPRKWSRAISWSLMLVTAGSIIWANVAKIEEAVSATGKLEASGATKEIQAPVGGVVKEIYVEDGKHVKAGESLLALDSTTALAQLYSLQKIRASLVEENKFYQSRLQGITVNITSSKIHKEMLNLTKSRAALVAENQLIRTQLDGSDSSQLTLEQRERLLSNKVELDTRVAAASSEVKQFKSQFQQTDVRLASTIDTLKMNQGILNDFIPLMKSGAISRIQILKQQKDVRDSQSEMDQLKQEKERLQAEISKTQAQLKNTVAVSHRDWINQIAENNKRIAEIDSQLTKVIVENNKRIAEIDSQLSQNQMNLKYQEIKSPVAGSIFELKAHSPGFVVTSSEPILKVVPDDALVAKVFITNKDIGFLREGMTVDVRIDSFPFSEFGDIKGKLVSIGSDALPPDQIYPFYRFPAKVQLEQQSLLVKGYKIPLQSGMSISANIKVRERTVMSIFTGMFSSSVESLKTVR